MYFDLKTVFMNLPLKYNYDIPTTENFRYMSDYGMAS